MAKGKLILICQSGGEFVTDDDGNMSYNGGEANAENITSETPFDEIKFKLAEACNLDQKTITMKYFLPGNKKNLIVMKNDKDVKRMIDFHGGAITAEVFVTGKPGFNRTALDMESNRETVTKKDETLKKDDTAKHKKPKTKKDKKLPTSPPPKRTTRATAAAAAAEVSSEKNKEDANTDKPDNATSDSSNESSSTSDSDRVIEKSNSDSTSDYVPKRSSLRNRNTPTASPADAVKKRRRTPSWKFDANGRPTIVSSPDSGSKSRGKTVKDTEKSKRKSRRLAAKGDSSKKPRVDSDQESEPEHEPEPEPEPEEKLSLTVYDDYTLPDTMVDSWKSAITGVGQAFDSVNEFRAALKKYAIANRFGYKFKKNDTSRAIGRCAAEGCTWKFYAAWVPSTKSFTIKTMNSVHSCDKELRKSAHPAKNWLVGTIKDRLKESPYLKPKAIANGILKDFGVELNYTQVWRGIGDAREQLHGSPKESYNKLPWFCEKILETNPGSVAKLVIGEKKRFKSLFVSFHALIRGFQNCRPLIFLESVSMKSRYGESLLIAIAVDGNDGFVPVAFAVVDVEDDDTWRWFLEELKGSILDSRAITFVVDRDKNLKKLVLEVFENAYIGYSIFQLLASFKRHMKGPFHGDGKSFLTVHLLAAAQAVRPVGFKKSTEHIKTISSQGYDWVMQIEPENYASSYFKGERYNFITEDVGESYAKLMEEYRHLPILQKIDGLIRTMIDDVEDAKVDASVWKSQLTASKEKKLENEKVRARGLKVLISSDVIFEVREDSTHVVNVGNWSCTCMGWKEIGLPCHHAVAVLNVIGKNVYDFCSGYFTADAYRLTYAESIRPVPIDGPPLLKDVGRKLDFEKIEGRNVDSEKMDVEKDEGEKLDGKKDEGGKLDVEKDSNVDTEMEEGSKVDDEKGEGSKVDDEKDEGSKVDNEKNEGSKVDNEKDEGSKVDNEKNEGSKVDNEKDEGGKAENGKDEGGSVDGEKEEGGNVDTEMEEGVKLDDKKDEGGEEEIEKDEGSKVENGKEEGGKSDVEKDSNVDTEMEESKKLDEEKDEGGIVEMEKDEGSKEENKKEEGGKLDGEKDEGKLREEHEDPNVFVLPPIPTKGSSMVKKEIEGVETESEMKRKVTCSKCKQQGHYKKSCKV